VERSDRNVNNVRVKPGEQRGDQERRKNEGQENSRVTSDIHMSRRVCSAKLCGCHEFRS
jgi:hypothetical protein